VRVDGQRIGPGDSLRLDPGSVVRISPLEPVVFGEYLEGVLSSRQWINGRVRRRSSSERPLDLLATLGTGPVNPEAPPTADADIRVSVSEHATVELTESLASFAAGLPLELEFGLVVLARVPDGAIVAVAEVGTRSEPGRSRLLERVIPGSAVKPILAAAILSQKPELSSMEVGARSGRIRSVSGASPIPAKSTTK